MKALKSVTALLVLCFVILATQVNAQKVGIAADKQKQANLEKNIKRQEELKKKYNSLTPEQAAEAKKRANEYKRSGGKMPSGTKAKPAPATSAVKTPAISNKSPEQQKQGTVKKAAPAKKPVFMDEKGKPKATPVTTKVGNAESKPAAAVKEKNAVVKGKPVKKEQVMKTAKVAEKSATTPKEKK